MESIYFLLFSLVMLYAILGNLTVYAMLSSRGVRMRGFLAGVPGYLYRVSVDAGPSVSNKLRYFSLSTSIAFLFAVLLGLGLAGFAN